MEGSTDQFVHDFVSVSSGLWLIGVDVDIEIYQLGFHQGGAPAVLGWVISAIGFFVVTLITAAIVGTLLTDLCRVTFTKRSK